MHGETVKRT